MLRAALINNALGSPCGECGQLLLPHQKLHVDHVIPIARGGSDHQSNLRVLHQRCNLTKGDRLPEDRVYATWR